MTTDNLPLKVGDRILLIGSHPWTGHTGTFIRQEEIQGFGVRPIVRLDSGQEIFVMRPEHWKAAK